MIKLKLLLLLTVCIAIACSENKTKRYERFLTNGKNKHWVYVRPIKNLKQDPKLWDSYVEVYKADHTYSHYYLVNGKVYPQQAPPDGRWSIEGDSIFVDYNKYRYRIEYLNEDILILNGVGDSTIVVYKAKELYSPSQFVRPWSPLPSTNFPF